MTIQRSLLAGVVLFTLARPVAAQAPSPPPPKQYDVQLRYRIRAGRNERLAQYFSFLRFLEKVGFQKDPGPDNEPEDATLDRMTGRIASNRVRELLQDPHVKSLLLVPADYKFPEDPEQPVKVQMELASLRSRQEQRLLSEQARERLQQLGFRDGFLYDHRGYTRLLGYLPSAEARSLFGDLRMAPAGWFTPETPVKMLPLPLRSISPIVLAEIVAEPADLPPPKELPPPPALPEARKKIAPEVRALLAAEEEAGKPRRLEIVLVNAPDRDARRWQRDLRAAVPEIVIEGHFGPYVTAILPPAKTQALAVDPFVSLIRLPPSAAPLPLPAEDLKNANREALRASGLEQLHRQGRRGQKIRVAVIADDFRGYEAAIQTKRLPQSTRLFDLTAANNPDLRPDAYPKDGIEQGHGTQCAQALAQAAPDADLLLLRVNPAAMYQLGTIARFINEDAFVLESLEYRRDELEKENHRLHDKWQKAISERNILFQQFGDDEETKQKREAHFAKVKALKEEEAAHDRRMARYLRYGRDLRELRDVRVVACTLDWRDGYPVDGSGPLARYLDDHPFRSTLWFQPAGETRGQVWTGLFRDADDNGAMEFAEPAASLPRGRWSREINFLAWQPFQGQRETLLPEKTVLRVSFQWTEPHDAAALQDGVDLYREPLAQVRLMLLRPRDPSGKKVGADEMEFVAVSAGPALRIHNRADAATYEVSLEYTAEAAAPYALYIEGRPPVAIGQIKGKERRGEFRPRILLDAVNPESRAAGRPIFLDYSSHQGTIGTPGDAQSAFTVGAADAANQPRPTTAPGPALGLELLAKPNFLSYDNLPIAGAAAPGSRLAASFAAGLTASVLSNGTTVDALRRYLADRPEGVLVVPPSR